MTACPACGARVSDSGGELGVLRKACSAAFELLVNPASDTPAARKEFIALYTSVVKARRRAAARHT